MRLEDGERVDVVQCDEFLARHAEFSDGMLGSLDAARLRSHAEACAACARYDRIVRKGVDLLRDMPAIEPSRDFESRLQHRIFHVQDAARLSGPRPSTTAATALAVAAVMALLAWSPVLLTGTRPSATTASGAARSNGDTAANVDAGDVYAGAVDPAPFTRVPAFAVASGRTFTPAAAGAGLAGGGWYVAPPQRAMLVVLPGPHSPLVVTPPAHRSVRAISSEYGPVE